MKWIKRLLFLIACCLLLVIVFVVVSFWMVNSRPVWYQARKLTTQQAADAARSMEDKLVVLRNWAQEADPPTFTLTLTSDELESFSAKWADEWKDKYASFLREPQLFIHDSKLILAGRLKEKDILASLYFAPKIDAFGQFDPNLVQIRGGRLPLPESFFNGAKQKAIDDLDSRLPTWIRDSKLTRNNMANRSMSAVGLGQLALALLQHETCEPFLYVPIDSQKSVPVRIRAIDVNDEGLTLKAEILSATERADLLAHIKNPRQVTAQSRAEPASPSATPAR